MKGESWSQWLVLLNSIIDSPTPRKVNTELLRCTFMHPESEPTCKNVEDFLAAIVRLRNSKCFGRFKYEEALMQHVYWLVSEIGSGDFMQTPKAPDLFAKEAASMSLSESDIGKLEAIATFCIDALSVRIKRENLRHLRQNEAFLILGEITECSEFESLGQQVLENARGVVREKDNAAGVSAARFIASYYCYKNKDLPAEVLAEINSFESDCANEGVARSLNVILVDMGELNEMSAMVRMEDFYDRDEAGS